MIHTGPDQKRSMLRSVVFITAGVVLVSILATVAGGLESFSVIAVRFVFMTICLAIGVFIERLPLSLAGATGLLSAFIFVTVLDISRGTVRTPVTAAYGLLVILGGLLFENRGIYTMSILSSAVVGILILSERRGWFPPPQYSTAFIQWITYSAVFLLSGLAVRRALSHTQAALEQADRELVVRTAVEETLRNREARLRALHEYSPMPAFIWQQKGHDFELIDFNRAALQFTGGAVARFKGVLASQMYEKSPEIQQAMVRASLFGFARQSELPYTLVSTGEQKIISAAYVSVPPDLIQVTIEDITARKAAEREMVHAREEADKANKAKSEFLSAMSHELRTPLNVIVGFAQMMERKDGEPETSVARILSAGWYLKNLVDDLLDMARIETGQAGLVVEAVELRPIVSECMELVLPLASKMNLRISETVPDLWLLADKRRLRQVLINLMTNAIKYNRPGGTAEITAVEEGGFVKITVRDSGRGIDPSILPVIFEPFVRGENKETVEGTGIGLWIAKQLVLQMNGTVEASSLPDQGSVFVIELRRAEPVRQDSQAEEPRIRLNGRILVVDDNELNLTIAAAACRYFGAEVETASSGAEALARLNQSAYDAVLLDLQMPEMDGFECARQIRAMQGPSAKVFIAAVSADAFAETERQAKEAGMDAFLAKPFVHSDLARLLQRR